MKSAICRGLVIRRVGKSTSGGQQKSKCVAKLEKTPLLGVKVRIKKKRPGTDFVSIPGSFMVAEAGLVCICAKGTDRGSPRSSPRRQQSTGLLHLDYSSPAPHKKDSHPDG